MTTQFQCVMNTRGAGFEDESDRPRNTDLAIHGPIVVQNMLLYPSMHILQGGTHSHLSYISPVWLCCAFHDPFPHCTHSVAEYQILMDCLEYSILLVEELAKVSHVKNIKLSTMVSILSHVAALHGCHAALLGCLCACHEWAILAHSVWTQLHGF